MRRRPIPQYTERSNYDNARSYECPTKSGPSQKSNAHRMDHLDSRFLGRQGQRYHLATFRAPRQVLQHSVSLSFGQSPLGEGRQHICIGMINGDGHRPKPIRNDFVYVIHHRSAAVLGG
jgi:hypothetical protein